MILRGMYGASTGASSGAYLGHVWENIWGMSGRQSGASSGACLGQHLGHIVNNGQQSVMPFFSAKITAVMFSEPLLWSSLLNLIHNVHFCSQNPMSVIVRRGLY